MEFPKYLNYEDFKEFFLIDFEVEKNKGETLLKYSHKLLKIYLDWKDYTRSHLSNEQVNQLFKIVCKGTIYENYDLFDSDNTDNELALQVFYINIMFKELDLIQIIDYLKNEIEKEKINILRFQGTSQLQQLQDTEPEPLTKKQVQKIGLLIRSGIVDFLREKNPNISNNQIASFIDLLSKEPLKQSSINPHLSKTNSKYAIQNQQDKNDLDFILTKYGISPQSE